MKNEVQPAANYEAIDRALVENDPLVPSSGFLSAVMERVQEESIAPKPIPFPWKRAMPGLALVAGTLVWLVYETIRMALAGALSIGFRASSSAIHLPAHTLQALNSVLWIGVAAAISLTSWGMARRLARRASLL